ncbi:hypothetical protein P3X46_028284 [Hevea brasiliensis]|uniref:ZF-HD dimerization-type domain-containing protein n=1 Tax=Hevea brasiliensis TaxID=3981 RepID=A0ABQ9KPD2_HEVBR|nr:zinc-finger homeodomain protein 2 [Hevea brasiliensis]KAJ9145959.1 hypothetical protein P3X46_028284 [Hevea brasiliensis]
MDLTLVPYQHTSPSPPHHNDHDHDHDSSPHPIIIRPTPDNFLVKYKECMRNHAASIGRHANDGCGEFMPRGDDGTLDCLTCAACGCHRNFHRREGASSLQFDHLHHQVFSYNGVSGKKHLMTSYFDDGDDIDDHDRRSETPEKEKANVVSSGVRAAATAAGGGKSKRFRTKFTQEQKDRMLDFAEKIGWRIHKHDDVALNHFCNEVGITRNVLKVWMHNNKNTHRRQEAALPVTAVAASPPSPPPLPPAPPQPVGV